MSTYASYLQLAEIFVGLSPDQLNKIAGFCQEKIYHTGEIILHEGTQSDELYIIVQGLVEIQVDLGIVDNDPNVSQTKHSIVDYSRGQSFGEIALVDHGLRSATARAVQDQTRLLIIPRTKLLALCEEDPQLGYYVMRNLAADLANKLRASDLRLRGELLNAQKQKPVSSSP